MATILSTIQKPDKMATNLSTIWNPDMVDHLKSGHGQFSDTPLYTD